MLKLQGVPASSGVAIGPAFVLDDARLHAPKRLVSSASTDAEGERLHHALADVAEELRRRRDAVERELGGQYGGIFSAQAQMVDDPALGREMRQLIEQRRFSAEFAASRVLRRYAKVFASLDDEYMGQRSHDVQDIEQRLLRRLLGLRRDELSQINSPVVVAAHHLTPSEAAGLPRRHVLGLVSAIGGAGSHTAILAEGMGVPAVLGVGPLLNDLSDGDVVVIDGDQGDVVIRPDEATRQRYEQRRRHRQSQSAALDSLRELPAATTDGCAIELFGNIEFPHEAELCQEHRADGIGLYRTEFLYLESQRAPSEEDHFAAYAQVVEAMAGRPVVVRTMDLGADKVVSPVLDAESDEDEAEKEEERNPALGLRSIRLALRDLGLFRTQLRAILRASAVGDVRIMFPLVSTLLELRQAKMILAEVMEDLEEQHLGFDRQIPIGMMVETPSAAIMAERFAREVDFLSIGTNDLIQYTLAADRGNKDVAGLYTASDPSVLRLIRSLTSMAEAAGTPISLCGQMGGNPIYAMLLIGLGLRRLSVPPGAIALLKRVCRSVSLAQCQDVAERALELDHARDVKKYLRDQMRRALGEEELD